MTRGRDRGLVASIEWQEVAGGYSEPVNRPLEGRAVAIVGGGPGFDPRLMPDLEPSDPILTNNAYTLARAPRLVVAFDGRWYRWHGAALSGGGHAAVCALRDGQALPAAGVRKMRKNPNEVWMEDRSSLAGRNSGHGAIVLAMHLGAARIYLAGFDMSFDGERTHWHKGHNVPSSSQNYEKRFRPALETLHKVADERGVSITAITPTAANIPSTPLSEALEDLS